jgi:hypothetical protein
VPSDSVFQWNAQVKDGQREAVGPLMDLNIQRLVALARLRLRSIPALASQGEDVAISAFKSLYLGAEGGRFSNFQVRNDLLRLLVRVA